MRAELGEVLAARRAPHHEIDTSRLRRERYARLQGEMERQGVDVALLLHHPHVTYATGARVRAVDVTHAVFRRPVAVVVRGEERPHLLSDGGDDRGAGELAVHHPAVWPELDEGARALADRLAEVAGPLADRRVAVDEQTGAMLRAGVLKDAGAVLDAAALVAGAKAAKTADELACIAEAQRRNETAMVATQAALVPGVTRSRLAGTFLAELRRTGDEANLIDPIFERMPRRIADGPATTTGGVAFPTGVGDPAFGEGDVVWVDTGVEHRGYASDFGRTWIVGGRPSPAEQALHERWCQVMVAVLDVLGPGVRGGDLCRVATKANGGDQPWLPHFYLAHGVGIESAEMPLLGTDLGPEVDDRLVLAPGMVLVLEPVIWEEGTGGYRAEEIVAVTDDGWCHLGGGHGYAPFA